ncbi:hypothetical protein BX600DRAFT_534991 [Xylariales sp. PMI_506]|nr:hypothetical protein BX600DRAFT_534991 [Xylariales sp. PMI_506]
MSCQWLMVHTRWGGGPPLACALMPIRMRGAIRVEYQVVRSIKVYYPPATELAKGILSGCYLGISERMTHSAADNPIVSLAESTALLSLLNKHPKTSLKPRPAPLHDDDGSRILSFDQERQVCSAFAFLAGVSDDPNHVMAVAVEEHDDIDSIHVKLAVNRTYGGFDKPVLSKVAEGFNRILHGLSRAARGDSKASIDQVFREVINLSRERILRRLRSRKVTLRDPKKPLLVAHVRSIREDVHPRLSSPKRQIFLQELDIIIQRMEEVEDAEAGPQEQKALRALVKSIRRFQHVVNLGQALNVGTGKLNPSIGRAVNESFGKLAHYRSATRYLYDLATECKIFKNFDIEEVLRPPMWIQQYPQPPPTYVPDLSNTLMQYGIRQRTINKLDLKIKCPRPQATTATEFTKIVKQTLSSGRVHAEVQLLSYYQDMMSGTAETVVPLLPPRIIASSKRACFLCNALFHEDGRFAVPGTHGVVYPGWLLPPNLISTASRLPQRLDQLVRKCNAAAIQRLLSPVQGAPVKKIFGPGGGGSGNESYVSNLPVAPSSVIESVSGSLAAASSADAPGASAATAVADVASPSSSSSSSSFSSAESNETIRPPKTTTEEGASVEEIADAKVEGEAAEQPPEQIPAPSGRTSASSSSHSDRRNISVDISDVATLSNLSTMILDQSSSGGGGGGSGSTSEFISSLRLRRGQINRVSLLPDHESVRVYSDSLQLFLEWPGKSSATAAVTAATTSTAGPTPAATRRIDLEVEWLADGKTEAVDSTNLHDVHQLPTEAGVECAGSSHLYLRAGEHVVRISRRWDPEVNSSLGA